MNDSQQVHWDLSVVHLQTRLASPPQRLVGEDRATGTQAE